MDLEERPNNSESVPNGAFEKAWGHPFKDRRYGYFVDAWKIQRMHLTAARLVCQCSTRRLRGLLPRCKAFSSRSTTLWRSLRLKAQPAFKRRLFDISSSPHKRKTFQEEMPLQYVDGLYDYAKVLTSDDTEAEDLVLETYLHAAKTYGQLRPCSDLQLWLFTILREAARNPIQDTRRKPITELCSLGLERTSGCEERSSGPSSSCVTPVRRTDVRSAIGSLPEELQELIVLRDIWAFSYQEIAGLLKYPVDIVRSRLSQARKELGQVLASESSQ